MVQEIQPKIKVIQSAILESENARKIISENVALIEKRLMPNIPSESETITRVRTELLESLHKSRAKRLNAIVKRQIILKQCEKVKKKLFRIEIVICKKKEKEKSFLTLFEDKRKKNTCSKFVD